MVTKIGNKENQEKMNSLLRGEISAVEAYNKVINTSDDKSLVRTLETIRNDHHVIVDGLKMKLALKGERPESDSGVWGDFVNVLISGAGFAGDKALIEALKKGEEHGIRECENLIDSEDLSMSDKSVIEKDILPSLKTHVTYLDKLSIQ